MKKPALLRAVGPVLQRRCACGNGAAQGECDACRARKSLVQRKPAAESVRNDGLDLVHAVLRAPGQPLEGSTRRVFEPRFGHDFSRVRVHANEQAAQSAHAVHALAYTVGRHVVFAAGQYTPGTHHGNALIAHELAHVVQQSGGADSPGSAPMTIGNRCDAAEIDADRAAAHVLHGGRTGIGRSSGATGARLLRQETAETSEPTSAGGGCRTITSTPCPGSHGNYTMIGMTGRMRLVNKGDCTLYVAAHDASGAVVGVKGVPIAPGESLVFDPPREAADVSFACATNCDGSGRLEHPFLCA
jgi:hypothetical protein